MVSEIYSYIITDKASTDLEGIIKYIAIELADPAAATNFIERYKEAINTICSFPESGALINNEFLPAADVRHIVVGNYIAFYYPDHDNKTCTVLRIIYGKRDLRNIILRHDDSNS